MLGAGYWEQGATRDGVALPTRRAQQPPPGTLSRVSALASSDQVILEPQGSLPMRALAFPGGISGPAPCRAQLGGTQHLIRTVSVAHKGGAVMVVMDVLVQPLRLDFLPPAPLWLTVRMVPGGQ